MSEIRYEKTTFGELKAGDWYRLPNCDNLAYLKPEGYAGFPTQEVYRLILPPDPQTVKVLESAEEYSSDWQNHPKTHLEEIHAIVTMELSRLKGAK